MDSKGIAGRFCRQEEKEEEEEEEEERSLIKDLTRNTRPAGRSKPDTIADANASVTLPLPFLFSIYRREPLFTLLVFAPLYLRGLCFRWLFTQRRL